MKRKIPVFARHLIGTIPFRDRGRQLQLVFDTASGIAGMDGREVIIRLTMAELADALAAIPALHLDPEDMKPLIHVLAKLRQMDEEDKKAS